MLLPDRWHKPRSDLATERVLPNPEEGRGDLETNQILDLTAGRSRGEAGMIAQSVHGPSSDKPYPRPRLLSLTSWNNRALPLDLRPR